MLIRGISYESTNELSCDDECGGKNIIIPFLENNSRFLVNFLFHLFCCMWPEWLHPSTVPPPVGHIHAQLLEILHPSYLTPCI